MRSIALFCFLLGAIYSQGQATLPFEINKGLLPADTAKINQDVYVGGVAPGVYNSDGFRPGDIVPDFTLYDLKGRACLLSVLLGEGKPVLLIAMSYTCPPSRESTVEPLKMINRIYGKKINIRIIYTIEAHPIEPDVCPNTGLAFTPQENISDSIYFRQPTTYLERKKMAEKFVARFKIDVPVLIDGPGNEYWKTFGPAPNNAYLITPAGVIYRKYSWFKESRDKLKMDIPLMLNDSSLLQTDFSKEAWISKDSKTHNETLFVPNSKHFQYIIIGKSGQEVFKKDNGNKSEINLEKIPLPLGRYSILVKTSNARSYCLRYERK